MQITLANRNHVPHVISFFNEYIERENNWVYSDEFLCPLGVRAAIIREQMIVAIDNQQVVGAFRFYKKKTSNEISLYQFAINEQYRGQGLLKKMFVTINESPIISLCPINSNFNDYYQKSGWQLKGQNNEFNMWVHIG